ncbi:MAG: calcium-translocating P-type ATPase, SERCA-type [Dethiobacteria bacterium]|jgi:Ca2+-transporting ATPase
MKKSRMWAFSNLKDIYTHFHVQPNLGLTEEEVLYRQKKWGHNLIQEKKQKGVLEIFLDQFRDFMVLVLLAATLISGLLGEYTDALTIIIIVILNALLGFIQEYKAERSFAALKKLSALKVSVLREGVHREIASEDVVPGDIVFLHAGDRVCADIRLSNAENLMVDESPLTGESTPVSKEVSTINTEISSPGDAHNMLFSGTLVTSGTGHGVVVATGMQTEIGNIATLIQEVEETSTPLQKRLAKLGKVLVAFCFFFCFLVVVLGLWRGEDAYKMLMAGISLAVAAIPEGLPAIVTIALALGVQRMVKRKAIVRRLPAVETLGCATVICSDKTGTITENKMTVKSIYAGGLIWNVEGEGYGMQGGIFRKGKQVDASREVDLKQALIIAAVCNNSSLLPSKKHAFGKTPHPVWEVNGDPTEGALLVCAAKGKINKETLEHKYKRIKEYPFNSTRKCMSVVCKDGERATLFVKGAPERVLRLSTAYYENGNIKKLDEDSRKKIMNQVEIMGAGALRMLAVAYKPLYNYSPILEPRDVERELIFVGFFGMIDPPRPQVYQAIENCKRAGIRIVMITGDHHHTAVAIARKVGILGAGGEVLTGTELDKMSEKELQRRVENVFVYSRVNPEHKLRIVRCLKSKGHVVAMTGDGVNDAPAVKEADIGVAMGLTGTEVTKEAASLILADDNFSTIVAAVEEGRGIYDNIRKFIRFLLGCNMGEILTVFLVMLLGLPLPLRPIQILWVNLVTDGLPAMALGVDPTDASVMSRPPRSPQEGIFGRGLWLKILSRGVLIGFTTLAVFIISLSKSNLVYSQTMALSTLILTQLLHVFECRSEYLTLWEAGITHNILLVLAVFSSFSLLLLIIYQPFLQGIFYTYPLTFEDWSLIFLASGLPHIVSLFLWCCRKITLRGIATMKNRR